MPQIIKYHACVKSNCTRGSACTRVLMREIGACDTHVRRVSHAFTVELVAGLYRTMTILHARGLGINTTTGSMHHVRHYNLMEFRINSGIRDFSTNDIIYLIRGDPVFSN